jgi:hypothetical protein
MNTWFRDAQFELPSVRRFFSGIANDLASRRNVLMLLPKQVSPADVVASFRHELERRTFECREMCLKSSALDRSPEAVICRELGLVAKSQDPEDLLSVIQDAPNIPRALILSGLCEIATAAQKEWLAFLVRLSRTRSGLGIDRQNGMTICAVAAAGPLLAHLPEADVGLMLRWWWGFPSNLEMQTLCRATADGGDVPLSQWRESMLLALAGTDAALLDVLWEDQDDTVGHKKEVVERWGAQMGWSAEDLIRNRARDIGGLLDGYGQSLSPSARFRALWAQGALYSNRECGVSLHPAALQMLKQEHQVDHRLWLAQSSLVLGWLNLVRLEVCEDLSSKYPSDWAWRWSPPTDAREAERLRQSSMHCELSHLKYLLTYVSEFRTERRWLPLVERAYNLRNPLAHQSLVSFEDVEQLWQEMRKALPDDPQVVSRSTKRAAA